MSFLYKIVLFCSFVYLILTPGNSFANDQIPVSGIYLDTLAVKLGYGKSFMDTSEINGGVPGITESDKYGSMLSFSAVFKNDYYPVLKPYLDYSRQTYDDRYYTSVGLGVRHDIRMDDSPLEFYLAGGVGYFFSQWRTSPVPETSTGLTGSESFGGTLKTGLDYYFTDNLALNVGLRWDIFDQDTTIIEGDSITTIREKSGLSLLTGLVYRFGKVKQPAPGENVNMDNDDDEIIDRFDYCPDTLPNVPVDANGCPLDHFSFNLTFQFGKFKLASMTSRPQFGVVAFLKENPDYHIVITGHSDSIGSDEANQKISLKRAEEARAFLVANGILSLRIEAEGKGAEEPIADNDTAEGRALNRRIHVEFIKKPVVTQ